jgi:hypothetical protein
MNFQEKQQLFHGDKFWGVDKAKKSTRAQVFENNKKKQEDAVENVAKQKAQQQQKMWEAEAAEARKASLQQKEEQHSKAMQDYMRTFWGSTNTVDVIKYHWSTKQEVKISPDQAENDESLPLQALLGERRERQPVDTFHSIDPLASATGRRSSYELHSLAEPKLSSTHLGGKILGKSVHRPNDPLPKLPTFGSTRPVSPLGAAFLTPFRTVRSIDDILEDEKAGALTGDKVLTPVAVLREIRFVTARGYMFREPTALEMISSGGQWVEVYCALWRTNILYTFKDEAQFFAFFSGKMSSNVYLQHYDFETVVSIKESSRVDLPFRGIDIIAPRQRITLCVDSDAQFAPWLRSLSNGIAARNAMLYETLLTLNINSYKTIVPSGDTELLNPVDAVEISSLNSYTLKYLSMIERSKVLESFHQLEEGEKTILEQFRTRGLTVGCSVSTNDGNEKNSTELAAQLRMVVTKGRGGKYSSTQTIGGKDGIGTKK